MNDYRGLVNEGATCYLNSLLQTLFMTPQFRRNVYAYIHDPKKISEVDSIPYQLQKLFVKLQENQSSVYTRGLLRSFQWNQVDSFQQHDVQEFCRKLFQAIEIAHKGNKWIQQLYSGTTVSFISCEKHTRENPELFMDISLPIRNQYTQKTYHSLQQCIMEYLRPQKLEDKIYCEQCDQKVNVDKGLKFQALPPILTLQLNRFQLNLQTFQREKVNSFLYYPQILEMNKLLKDFNQIEINPVPKDLQKHMKVTEKKKSERMTDFGGGGLMVEGKSIPKRKNSDQIESKKEKTRFFDEEGKQQRERQTKQASKEDEKSKSMQILKNLKMEKQSMDKKMEKINKQESEKPKQKKYTDLDLQNDMLFGSKFEGELDLGAFNAGSFDRDQKPKFEQHDVNFQHEETSFSWDKEYQPNTYVLSAVLVHSGGAYGGHYFAYIWNGTDWYKFNDNSVTKVDKKEIRKYGNPTQSSSYGANAYLLFYRRTDTMGQMKSTVQIPKELAEKVEKDKVVDEHVSDKKTERMNQIQKGVIIKIYTQINKHETIVVKDRLVQTFGELRANIKQLLAIEEQDQDWRIRRYNKNQDTLHQIYGHDLDSANLDSLGFRQTFYLSVEKKKSAEEFQEYDPKKITIKLNVWRQNITILTQQALKPYKLAIRQETQFEEFYNMTKKELSIQNLIIIRRTFSVSNPYQVLSLENSRSKTLNELRFFNCINLYVEEKTEGLKWENEFQMEKYRCLIRFNNPKEGDDKNQELFIDTRKTLGQLKERLSQIIGVPSEEFRVKRSKQVTAEMTTFKKKLIDLRFISQDYLYLELGRSSKGTVILKRAVVELIEDKIEFNVHEQFQIQLNSSITTVADLKNIISAKYEIESMLIRIREFKAFQFGQIFNDSELIQRIKEKSLIWQQIQTEDPRGIQVYFRVFDMMTMELGPLLYTFIDQSANYEEFTCILEEESMIKSDRMLVWKAQSNYIEKSMFFDCEWVEIKFIPKGIRAQPLFLSRDGQIIILKEADEPYHPKPSIKHSSKPIIEPAKEASLKITVIEEKEDEVEIQPIVKQSD